MCVSIIRLPLVRGGVYQFHTGRNLLVKLSDLLNQAPSRR